MELLGPEVDEVELFFVDIGIKIPLQLLVN